MIRKKHTWAGIWADISPKKMLTHGKKVRTMVKSRHTSAGPVLGSPAPPTARPALLHRAVGSPGVLDFENVLLILLLPVFFFLNIVCLENNVKIFALFNINLVTVTVGKCIDLKPVGYSCFCEIFMKHAHFCHSVVFCIFCPHGDFVVKAASPVLSGPYQRSALTQALGLRFPG